LSNKQQQANRLVHKPSQAGRLAIKQIRLAGQQAATSRDNSACGFSQLKLDYHKLRPNVSDGISPCLSCVHMCNTRITHLNSSPAAAACLGGVLFEI
jgi:hypothetical protein